MSKLFQAKQKIEQTIQSRGLEEIPTKGKIGLRCGMVIGLINENTPDDGQKLSRLIEAAEEVLETKFLL